MGRIVSQHFFDGCKLVDGLILGPLFNAALLFLLQRNVFGLVFHGSSGRLSKQDREGLAGAMQLPAHRISRLLGERRDLVITQLLVSDQQE